MARRIVILGSTGSIGQAAIEVAAGLPDDVRIVGLAARRAWRLLAEQARRLEVPVVALADEQHADDLRRAVPAGTVVLAGPEAATELVRRADADFVLSAVVGAAGLPATLAAVERGLDVGLANKESLVVAGSILVPAARAHGSRLIPVDSEHSAIFQAIQAGRAAEVQRVYLTASGGPFRTWTREQMENATLEQALRHPVWSMGPKVTIDSATMMNKALEIIEAVHLFDLRPEQIQVLIHPESIVHSMVEFCDGSVVAQMAAPDMKTPIQYAMTWPRRRPGCAARLDWSQAQRLHFEPPDPERFPALRLGYEAARENGAGGAVLNAANEAAVEAFRAGRIPFGRITQVTAEVFARRRRVGAPTLEDLLAADRWARSEVRACL